MLELRLLGEPLLQDDTGAVKQPWRTHIALLAYLAMARAGVTSRALLASVFWPDVPEAKARRALRQAIFQLRRAVGEVVDNTGDCLRLELTRIAIDVTRFEEAVEAGRFAEAVALYHGDFLGSFTLGSHTFDEWADRQRARLVARAAAAFAALADAAAAAAKWGEALQWVEQWLAREPFSEDAAARLIALRARAGDRGGALAAYEAFRKQLQNSFGVTPGPQIEGLVARIQRAPAGALGSSIRPVSSTQVVAAPAEKVTALPLVGREADFASLHRSWDTVRAGQRQFVLLAGEAGIGKTRLAQEFADWAQLEGATVLRGRAYEMERTVPYTLLAGLLRGALEAPGLAAVDAASLAELSRIVPEFATRFRGVQAPFAADLDTGRVRLLEALRDLVDNLAFEAPVLLLLDDLVWADEPTLVALHYLWRRLGHVPLFVLATARSFGPPIEEPVQSWLNSLARDAPGAVNHLTLEPLREQDLVRLATELGVTLPDRSSVTLLREETGGNPLFVAETLRARLEGSGPGVSQTVRAVITERVSRLNPAARELLRAAAVLGRRFPFPFAAALAKLPQSDALDALEELLLRRLLQQVELGYDFLHDVVRETVYDGLGSERRRLLHQMAVERLAPAQGDAVGLERASTLAMHALRAGLRREAREWLVHSAELARQLYAGSEAERFLEEALETEESENARAAILERIADLRFAQSRFGHAALTYHAVLSSSACTDSDRLRVRSRLLDASLRSGLLDLENARHTVQQILRDAEAAGHSQHRDLLLVLASAELRSGAFQSAQEHAVCAVAAARAAGDAAPLVHALLLRAQAATLQRSATDVLPVLEEATRLAGEHGLQRELCDAETEYATELCRQERWDDAIALWKRVIVRGDQTGVMGTVAVAHVNLADLLLRRGQWERAAQHLSAAEERARRFHFPHLVADVLVNRALLHWLRDQPEQLQASAQAALEYAQDHRLSAAERNARALLVLALLALGRQDEAREAVQALDGMRLVSHPTWSDDRELAVIARARFEAFFGEHQVAVQILRDGLQNAGDAYGEALLQLELADLLRDRDPAAARELAAEAASVGARLQALTLLLRIERNPANRSADSPGN